MQSWILEERRLRMQTGPEAIWPRDQVVRSKPVWENVTELIMTDPTDPEPSASQARAREMTEPWLKWSAVEDVWIYSQLF